METVKKLRLGHAGLLFQLKSWVPPQLPFISPAQSIQVLSFTPTAAPPSAHRKIPQPCGPRGTRSILRGAHPIGP